MSRFDNATYYDWRDSETLSYETVEECLEAFVEFHAEADEPVEDVVRRLESVKVTAYVRKTVADEWVEGVTRSLAETLEEWWIEEYGNPDGDDENIQEHWSDLLDGVRTIIGRERVWQCDDVATRTYTADEVLKLLAPDSCEASQ